MSSGKTCGKCKYFLKINFNDKPTFRQRNGICEKYDYNICSDGTYAQKCSGYTGKRYIRHKESLKESLEKVYKEIESLSDDEFERQLEFHSNGDIAKALLREWRRLDSLNSHRTKPVG